MTMRRVPITARLALACLLATGCYVAFAAHDAHAQAKAFRIDDSASQVLQPDVTMQWDTLAPMPGSAAHTVTGRVGVLVRLDVAPWRGQSGRIYMTLPASPVGPVTARWTTRGPLQPGELRSGERQLVYAGPINVAVIEDTMQLTLEADGRHITRRQSLDFGFEIEPGVH